MPPRRGGCLGGGRKSDQDNTSMYTPNAGTPQQPTTTNKLPSTLAARAELVSAALILEGDSLTKIKTNLRTLKSQIFKTIVQALLHYMEMM
ncbi:unnamed protein product [Rotaria socialis]|uniref:Uncharacterized protein n=1 Tax=Rotaria socialis TaxID=392032 RepID=A0A818PF36_9BILA|nr:unnamed protein product [Rotaria socialis]